MSRACRSPASRRSVCPSDARGRRFPARPTGGGSCGAGCSPGVLRRCRREYSAGSRRRGRPRSEAQRQASGTAGADGIRREAGLMAPDVVAAAAVLQEQRDVPAVARGVVRTVGRVLVADERDHGREALAGPVVASPVSLARESPVERVAGAEIVQADANGRDEQAAVRREIVLVDGREVAVQQRSTTRCTCGWPAAAGAIGTAPWVAADGPCSRTAGRGPGCDRPVTRPGPARAPGRARLVSAGGQPGPHLADLPGGYARGDQQGHGGHHGGDRHPVARGQTRPAPCAARGGGGWPRGSPRSRPRPGRPAPVRA